MDFVTAAVSNVMSIVVMCLFAAGVMKVFQAVTTLEEIRDRVQEISRNQVLASPQPVASGSGRERPGSAAGQTGEEMLRNLDAHLGRPASEGSPMDEVSALDPEVVEPGDRHV